MIANFMQHSANERMFLAWVRTSMGVLGLGHVTAQLVSLTCVRIRQVRARIHWAYQVRRRARLQGRRSDAVAIEGQNRHRLQRHDMAEPQTQANCDTRCGSSDQSWKRCAKGPKG